MIKWRVSWTNPRILETAEDVDEVNAIERRDGTKIVWRIRDSCYWVKFTGYQKGQWNEHSDTCGSNETNRLCRACSQSIG